MTDFIQKPPNRKPPRSSSDDEGDLLVGKNDSKTGDENLKPQPTSSEERINPALQHRQRPGARQDRPAVPGRVPPGEEDPQIQAPIAPEYQDGPDEDNIQSRYQKYREAKEKAEKAQNRYQNLNKKLSSFKQKPGGGKTTLGRGVAGTSARTGARGVATKGMVKGAVKQGVKKGIKRVILMVAPYVLGALAIIVGVIFLVVVVMISICYVRDSVPGGGAAVWLTERITGYDFSYCDSVRGEAGGMGTGAIDWDVEIFPPIADRTEAVQEIMSAVDEQIIRLAFTPTLPTGWNFCRNAMPEGQRNRRDCFEYELNRANDKSFWMIYSTVRAIRDNPDFPVDGFLITAWVEGITHTSNSGEHGPNVAANPNNNCLTMSPDQIRGSTCGNAVDFDGVRVGNTWYGVDCTAPSSETGRIALTSFLKYMFDVHNAASILGPTWMSEYMSDYPRGAFRFGCPGEGTHNHVHFGSN